MGIHCNAIFLYMSLYFKGCCASDVERDICKGYASFKAQVWRWDQMVVAVSVSKSLLRTNRLALNSVFNFVNLVRVNNRELCLRTHCTHRHRRWETTADCGKQEPFRTTVAASSKEKNAHRMGWVDLPFQENEQFLRSLSGIYGV